MASHKGKRLVKYVPDYVVFDLETTGISVIKDDIIEISAVKVLGGQIADTFSTLVNPGRPIPYYATQVNGITDEMVEDVPDIREALADFLAFAGEAVLVGHNIQSFDLNFVSNAAESLFGKTVENDYIDTLYMARSCLPELSHHKLVDVASHFHISVEGAHRALNDCIMNQKCFEELGKLQADQKLDLCPRCGGELRKRNGKFGEFFGCSNYPACRYTRNI
ncbi:MAG: topoisomerase DNA-binding C4 zinc finger domain-containing protein [Roseburia sp.]|nr:topoisomerase DNA-binding C4 zinc finger domain-containing protein [Roseburia sp.]